LKKIFRPAKKINTMNSFLRKYILIISALIAVFPIYSQVGETTQFSLLTESPRDKAVYTIYGHTALRVCDTVSGKDFVLNWGTFDFDRPNFIYHFVRGETDYFLSDETYDQFEHFYANTGARLTEQILNIPNDQKGAFLQAVIDNLQPQNREYRYNYFFDNCTLRPRDLVERFCGGELVYPALTEPLTLRTLVHRCTEPYPWMKFGIDLVIGYGADSLIVRRTSLFLPEELCKTLETATIRFADGREEPVVASTKIISEGNEEENRRSNSFILSPLCVFSAIFLIILILSITYWNRKYYIHFPFAVIFLAATLGGSLVAFLMLFSEHPCVSENLNIIWLHPLHILGFVSFLLRKPSRLFFWYHLLNLAILSLYLLSFNWLPQKTDLACLPFIASLWLGTLFFLKKYHK